jgi:hypothetical protein
MTALFVGCAPPPRRSRRPVRGVLFDVDDTPVDDTGAQRIAIGPELAVGIVTNADANHQRRKLEIVGVGGCFDVVVWLDRSDTAGAVVRDDITRVASLAELEAVLA